MMEDERFDGSMVEEVVLDILYAGLSIDAPKVLMNMLLLSLMVRCTSGILDAH